MNEATARFATLSNKVPFLLDADPALCCQASLQALCDALNANPTLGLMHLAVMMDLRNVITKEGVLK